MRKLNFAVAGAMALIVAAACTDKSLTEAGRRGIAAGGGSRALGDPVTGAVYTSTNPSDDHNAASNHDLCQNQKDSNAPAINCNIYFSKDFVWLSGGPVASGLAEGTYVFAVVVPGGQGGGPDGNPNDCTDQNLSDLCVNTNTGAGDTWEHRVFSVDASGVITYPAPNYPGGHDWDPTLHMVRLMGYDDTPNPGGEYVMAICSLDGRDPTAENGPGVDPSLCKYDNFKVDATAPCDNPASDDCLFHPVDASITTDVHDANHNVITNTFVGAFSTLAVHDKAAITFTGGDATLSLPTGSYVVFYFFKNNQCTGDPFATSAHVSATGTSVATVENGLPETVASGSFAYRADFFSGDVHVVTNAQGDCEPFGVTQLGKTMGFWGNTNGIAYITAHGGYSGNAVAIGRGSNIDTQGEAAKVLPLTLNACGKGGLAIYTVGSSTAGANCALFSGINIGTFNTNASQLLALGYNINLVSGFTGQTIGGLGCSAYLTAGLVATNTVNNAFAAAVSIVNTTTTVNAQGALGAMNLLLNCLNRES
jgi:hypothetical protein